MTKNEIIKKIVQERGKLEKFLEKASDEEKITTQVMGTWTIKDIMMHLVWWERHFLEMLENRDKTVFPERLRTQKLNIKEINANVYKEYKNVTLDEAKKEFADSYKKVLVKVEGLPESLLGEEVPYEFSKGNTWEKHIWWDTYNHYKWASTHIRKWLKEM